MFDAKTPEAAAYLAQREATEKSQRRIWHRIAIALGVALSISLATNVYSTTLVHQIRTTQVANTKSNEQLARSERCVALTTNNAVQDVILALVDHDTNKADYKALAKC